MTSGGLKFSIGFLIDPLTALMMMVVSFVSLMVHVYTIGYMADDPGLYPLLRLHLAVHVLHADAGDGEQLPAVVLRLGGGRTGVVPADRILVHAPDGNLRQPQGVSGQSRRRLRLRAGHRPHRRLFRLARLRDGVQRARRRLAGATLALGGQSPWSVLTAICIWLFIGAMGKSAQFPLHVWLPDSMEGPTPISALIHAATMVTAGIFMVARMSPLFELSETALSFVTDHRRDHRPVHGPARQWCRTTSSG